MATAIAIDIGTATGVSLDVPSNTDTNAVTHTIENTMKWSGPGRGLQRGRGCGSQMLHRSGRFCMDLRGKGRGVGVRLETVEIGRDSYELKSANDNPSSVVRGAPSSVSTSSAALSVTKTTTYNLNLPTTNISYADVSKSYVHNYNVFGPHTVLRPYKVGLKNTLENRLSAWTSQVTYGDDLDKQQFLWDNNDAETPFTAARDTFLTCLSQFRHVKGQLGNLHLAVSVHKGVSSTAAFEVMQLFGRSVDAEKSGDHVKLPQTWLDALRSKKKDIKWPHFMEKDSSVSYKDGGLLGQLYDQAHDIRCLDTKRLQMAIQTSMLHPDRDMEVFRKTENVQVEAKRARRLMNLALSSCQPLAIVVRRLRDDFVNGLDLEFVVTAGISCLESLKVFDTLPKTVQETLITKARIWYTVEFEIIVDMAEVQAEDRKESHSTQTQPLVVHDLLGRLAYSAVGAVLLLKAKQSMSAMAGSALNTCGA